jgi:hypothetical protein
MSSQPPLNAQHVLNPLHVYCRLRDMGLPGSVARAVTSGYERAVYRPLMGGPELAPVPVRSGRR